MKLFPPGKNVGVVILYFAGFIAVLLIMLVIAIRVSQ